ncbi:hypothetical protein RhiJN_05709 [Ceratobasidium sp. AG-Ba]|nr:hypothetical protein RhiJN_05709 [Ceratobasidium sp. AG-Ba]
MYSQIHVVCAFVLTAATALVVARLMPCGDLTVRPTLPKPTAPSSTHRGRQQGSVKAPVQAHLAAPAEDEDNEWVVPIVVSLTNFTKATTDFVLTVLNALHLAADNINTAFSGRRLAETLVCPAVTLISPVAARLRRGVVQVPVPVMRVPNMPYRYVCPISFVLAMFVVLVFVAGVSAVYASSVCAAVCLTLVAGDRIGVDEEENLELPSTPEMGDVGQVIALHG